MLSIHDANALGNFRVSVQHFLLGKSLTLNDYDFNQLGHLLELTAKKIETDIQADKLESGRRVFLLKCQEDCVMIKTSLNIRPTINMMSAPVLVPEPKLDHVPVLLPQVTFGSWLMRFFSCHARVHS